MLTCDANELLPREKMEQQGASALSTSELLAIILGRGVSGKNVFDLSKEIAGYLETLPRIPAVEDLLKIKGLGRAKACQIVACLELSSRFLLAKACESVKTPAECAKFFRFMKFDQQENFAMISLSSANVVLKTHVLTRGVVDHTLAHPREAFSKAIEDRAVAVIFAHNHPSGSLMPSADDLKLTRMLCSAGSLLQIKVLDHIIIGASGFCSIRQKCPEFFEVGEKMPFFEGDSFFIEKQASEF